MSMELENINACCAYLLFRKAVLLYTNFLTQMKVSLVTLLVTFFFNELWWFFQANFAACFKNCFSNLSLVLWSIVTTLLLLWIFRGIFFTLRYGFLVVCSFFALRQIVESVEFTVMLLSKIPESMDSRDETVF